MQGVVGLTKAPETSHNLACANNKHVLTFTQMPGSLCALEYVLVSFADANVVKLHI